MSSRPSAGLLIASILPSSWLFANDHDHHLLDSFYICCSYDVPRFARRSSRGIHHSAGGWDRTWLAPFTARSGVRYRRPGLVSCCARTLVLSRATSAISADCWNPPPTLWNALAAQSHYEAAGVIAFHDENQTL